MAKIGLFRFLSNSDGEPLERTRYVELDTVNLLLDKSEELLMLAMSVLKRPVAEISQARRVA